MLTHKDIAEVYRIGLTIGMFTPQDVVVWADSVIAAEANPDFALFDVSTAGGESAGKMATLLRVMGGEHDPKTARKVLYGLLGRRMASDSGAADSVAAQVKAIQQGEGVHAEVGEDLKASLAQHDAFAAEWLALKHLAA
jgi:hypothetical protein